MHEDNNMIMVKSAFDITENFDEQTDDFKKGWAKRLVGSGLKLAGTVSGNPVLAKKGEGLRQIGRDEKAAQIKKEKAKKSVNKNESEKAFLIMSPFKSTMQNALKAEGSLPPNDIAPLTEMFYTKIVQKNSSSFDAPDISRTIEMYGTDRANYLSESITAPVIAFIKAQMEKKQSGAQLSPVLDAIASGGLATQAALTKEVQNQVNTGIGKFITDNIIWIVIAVIVVITAYVLLRK